MQLLNEQVERALGGEPEASVQDLLDVGAWTDRLRFAAP